MNISRSSINISSRPILAVTGVLSATGDTTIIAAPGSGLSIRLSSILLQLESSVSLVVLLRQTNATNLKRFAPINIGDGLLIQYSRGTEFVLTANTGLVLNLSTGTSTISYSFEYSII